MRVRTAALLAPAVLAASLVAVGGAQAATPGRALLPASTAPFRLGFDRDSQPDAFHRTIFSTDASGQDEQQVTSGSPDPAKPVDDGDPAYSADGTRIAYAEDPDPDNTDAHNGYIAVANADGTGTRTLDGTVSQDSHYGPTWSPDASMIAYGVENDGSATEVVRVSDGVYLGNLSFPGGAPSAIRRGRRATRTPSSRWRRAGSGRNWSG